MLIEQNRQTAKGENEHDRPNTPSPLFPVNGSEGTPLVCE